MSTKTKEKRMMRVLDPVRFTFTDKLMVCRPPNRSLLPQRARALIQEMYAETLFFLNFLDSMDARSVQPFLTYKQYAEREGVSPRRISQLAHKNLPKTIVDVRIGLSKLKTEEKKMQNPWKYKGRNHASFIQAVGDGVLRKIFGDEHVQSQVGLKNGERSAWLDWVISIKNESKRKIERVAVELHQPYIHPKKNTSCRRLKTPEDKMKYMSNYISSRNQLLEENKSLDIAYLLAPWDLHMVFEDVIKRFHPDFELETYWNLVKEIVEEVKLENPDRSINQRHVFQRMLSQITSSDLESYFQDSSEKELMIYKVVDGGSLEKL